MFKLKILDNTPEALSIFPEFLGCERTFSPKEEVNGEFVVLADSFKLDNVGEDVPTIEEKPTLNNSNVIRNISFDESEIIRNILDLYCNGAETFEADITASKLAFYRKRKGNKYEIPEPKMLFDVYPQREDIKQITPFEKLPIEPNSVESICVDLPFVISPKTCASFLNKEKTSNRIAKRFSSWYPYREGYYNMAWWLRCCYDVLKDKGIVAWKMQNTCSGSIQHWWVQFCFLYAQKLGFYVIDEFILEAKNRLLSPSKIKKVQHSRKYTCSWLVLQKNPKLAKKNNCLDLIEEIDSKDIEHMEFELK